MRRPLASFHSALVAALLAGVAGLGAAACAAPEPPPPPRSPGAPSQSALAPAPLPRQLLPQPQVVQRLESDVAVSGPVVLTTEPMIDQSTREAAVQVLRAAGAEQVTQPEPGAAPTGGLHVHIGGPQSRELVQARGAEPPDVESSAGGNSAEGYELVVRAGQGRTPGASAGMIVIGAAEPRGAFYGVQTLRQLASPGRIAGVHVVDSPAMPIRGVIEGFYGSPWTHEERMAQLAFAGQVKFNTYVYAPKDDPYHRERWREPYPPEKFAQVRELIDQARRNHVKFTFALSPGTSVCYSSEQDFQSLLSKLDAVYRAGVRDFSVLLDDISYTRWNCPQDQGRYGPASPEGAGQAQTDLLNRVQREFVDRHPGVSPLQMVPTEYSDIEDSGYKTALRSMEPPISAMWTGDGVIPPRITVDDASAAREIWGRKPLLWDNYPVNDFDATVGRIMLGPYAMREAGLSEQLSGVVVNPMNQAAASTVVEMGAADFAWNDRAQAKRELSAEQPAFDAQRAWRAAAEHLAQGSRPDAAPADPQVVQSLLTFFDLNHHAPLPRRVPWLASAPGLNQQLRDFQQRWDSGDRAGAVTMLRGTAHRIAEAPERIRASAPADFVGDTEPWLRATDLWGDALLATVDGLDARARGDQLRADQLFGRAQALAKQAEGVQTVPGETRPQGPVKVGDGVLDVFVQRAPALR